LQAAHRAIQPEHIQLVPYHVGADFALAAAEKNVRITKSLEVQA
jgi:hypothetical protein